MSYISDIRKKVGHDAIMATSTTCFIYDKDKGLLFEKRSDNGLWCIPGGALEMGESLEEGLRREILEETNLTILDPILFDVKANIHVFYPNQDEVYYTDVIYSVTKYEGELMPDAESIELRWFPIDALPDEVVPTQVDYINEFVKTMNK